MRTYLLNLVAVSLLTFSCSCTDKGRIQDEKEYDSLYSPFKVMSFNILVNSPSLQGEQIWDFRKEACVRMLTECAPDIVGLQECYKNQYDYLLEQLPVFNGVYIPENKKNFGTCILFRKDLFELESSGYLWYSANPTVPSPAFKEICDDPTYRTYIWADLKMPSTGRMVYFYSTHFPRNYSSDNKAARQKCAQAMVDHAASRLKKGDIVFMTGDFNCSLEDNAGRFSLYPLTSWMDEARSGVPDGKSDTWCSMNSYKPSSPFVGPSIDYIFFRNIDAQEFRTVVEKNYGVDFISDHYPIILTCGIPYKK